ncbi:MAG TPA: MazG nucleotide pyrophosphohydrolase domain-containing protein, partial [Aestuariivirgaceae bacterium]|nr:MazG nucleotide pyrophosphohydrolase domain-containing protein [Aestuariivirgaceae bacterium]
WPSSEEVVAKIHEEANELRSAPREKQEEELGDLLFAVSNLARHLNVDAEAALRKANSKFERRFAYIEAALRAKGKHPSQSTLEEMDALWNDAKARESKTGE